MEIGIENGDGARMREIENGRVVNEDKIDKEDQNSSGYVEGGADIDDSNDSAQFEMDFGVSTMVLSSDDRVEKKAEVLVRGLSPAKDEAPVANDIPHTNIESVEEVELLVSEEIQVMGRSDTDQGLISEAERLTDNVAKTNGEIGLSDTVDGDSPVNVNILVSERSPIVGEAGTEEVSADKVEGLKDNVVENGISNLRDVTEISGDGKVVVDLSDEDHKAHENGVSVCDSMNTGSQEKQVYGLPEFQNVDEAEGTDFQDVPKFNDDTMSRSPTVNSVDQTNGTPSTGKQEKGSGLNNDAAEHGSKNHDDKAEEEKGIGANLKNEIKEPKIPDIKENEAEIVQLQYLENGDNEPNLPVSTFYQDENPTMRDEISSVMAEIAEEPPIEESPNSLDNSYVEERTIDTVLQNSLPKEVKKEEVKSSKPELNLSKKMSDKDERYTPRMREQEAKPAMNDSSSTVQSATPAPGHPHLPARPAGLGRAAPLLEPAPRIVQQPRVNGATVMLQNQLVEEPSLGEAEEYDETREKLQMIRVKFLRLAHRLGQTPHNVVVAQVLYRLGLAEQLRGRSGGRVAAFSFDRASAMAEQLEAAGREPLDFTCTIMVLGKSGVGKSATINSIFDEVKFGTDAFHLGTKRVQDVVGTVQGIKVRVIDTPGLLSSWSDQRQNERILHSVKQFIKKTPPDIVLYLDRLDMPSRDFGDMPLLRTITETFGPSIWFNAIVVLTHAASAPPEGPNGTATSYDMFVTQRSHAVQQEIRQAAGDMRLMNPVSLVENHSAGT
ncbi:hypothetical protein Leryth_007274 [Lithospermum erythrorhizon]|nr:hypothetical protein Leryth_007274 [Lithospermum erythrorhizon]